jgi:hypothetical protein
MALGHEKVIRPAHKIALDGPGQASCTLREIWVRPGKSSLASRESRQHRAYGKAR